MNEFIKIDKNVYKWLQVNNIKPSAQLLYIDLLGYCYGNKNTCYPTLEQLAEDMNCNISTIQRGIKVLVTAGLISIKHRKCASGISNEYMINPVTATAATPVTDPPQEPPQEPQYETKAREYEVVNPVATTTATPVFDRNYFQQRETAWNKKICEAFATATDEQIAVWQSKRDNCTNIIKAMDSVCIFEYKALCEHYDNNGLQYTFIKI